MKRMDPKERARWVSKARRKYAKAGEVRVDEVAHVSARRVGRGVGDSRNTVPGAWVQAWVWVFEDDPEEKNAGA